MRVGGHAGVRRLAAGVFEHQAGFTDRLEPPARVTLEASAQEPDYGRGRRSRPHPVGLARQHGGPDVGDGVAVEQTPAGQHLVQNRAEGPDVGAPVDRPGARLLG
jgi:hypothetical protein